MARTGVIADGEGATGTSTVGCQLTCARGGSVTVDMRGSVEGGGGDPLDVVVRWGQLRGLEGGGNHAGMRGVHLWRVGFSLYGQAGVN
jgi:hypothetical protein